MRHDPADRAPLKVGKFALDVRRAKELDPLYRVGLKLQAVFLTLGIGHLAVDGRRPDDVRLQTFPLLESYFIRLFHDVRGSP